MMPAIKKLTRVDALYDFDTAAVAEFPIGQGCPVERVGAILVNVTVAFEALEFISS